MQSHCQCHLPLCNLVLPTQSSHCFLTAFPGLHVASASEPVWGMTPTWLPPSLHPLGWEDEGGRRGQEWGALTLWKAVKNKAIFATWATIPVSSCSPFTHLGDPGRNEGVAWAGDSPGEGSLHHSFLPLVFLTPPYLSTFPDSILVFLFLGGAAPPPSCSPPSSMRTGRWGAPRSSVCQRTLRGPAALGWFHLGQLTPGHPSFEMSF